MAIRAKILKKIRFYFFQGLSELISLFGLGFIANLISGVSRKAIALININDTDVRFYTPNALSLWRARTLMTKEPDTIEWIDGFDAGDVFWDIGANVGCYTLYASRVKGVRTLAFEPSPSNYPLLVRNVEINGVSDKVSAFGIALSNETQISTLNMTTTEAATAHSTFGVNRNQFGKEFKAAYQHTMMGYSVDDFIKQFNVDRPNHIKIDVDGIEDLIVEGAEKTLSDKAVKSVLIELNIVPNQYDKKVIDLLNKAGFDAHQTRECSDGIANYIFKRKG